MRRRSIAVAVVVILAALCVAVAQETIPTTGAAVVATEPKAERCAREVARVLQEYDCTMQVGAVIDQGGKLHPIIRIVDKSPGVADD